MKRRMGPARMDSDAAQTEQLDKLRKQLKDAQVLDSYMVQIDECCFYPASQKLEAWAPKRLPLAIKHRKTPGKFIAVLGGISVDKGKELFHYKEAAFDQEDYINFLTHLKKAIPADKKLMVFQDNASIHKG